MFNYCYALRRKARHLSVLKLAISPYLLYNVIVVSADVDILIIYGRDTIMYNDSYFDGGLLSYIGWSILGALVTALTFGICYPWAVCMIYGWKINHTVVNGRRLRFTGSAMGLFGNWIKWMLLTIITFGIYSFWVFIALEKWKVKHTVFAN